jgi:hypothetical protein
MQHSFTNDTIYKNIFCLLREKNFYLSRVVINGILEYGILAKTYAWKL